MGYWKLWVFDEMDAARSKRVFKSVPDKEEQEDIKSSTFFLYLALTPGKQIFQKIFFFDSVNLGGERYDWLY